jgi:hypothetical protein
MNWRVFLLIFLFPAFLSAQVPELPPVPRFELTPVPSGDDNIVVLTKGEKAPFSGQLYDPATALRWANYMEQYRLQLDLCYTSARRLQSNERDYWQGLLEIEESAHKEIRLDLQTRLERVEKKSAELEGELRKGPPWYNTRTFGIIVGAVGAATVFGLSVWAVSSMK